MKGEKSEFALTRPENNLMRIGLKIESRTTERRDHREERPPGKGKPGGEGMHEGFGEKKGGRPMDGGPGQSARPDMYE